MALLYSLQQVMELMMGKKNMQPIIHRVMTIQFLSVPLVVMVYGVIGPLIILLLIWPHRGKMFIVPLLEPAMNHGLDLQWHLQMQPVFMVWYGHITLNGQTSRSGTRFHYRLTLLFMILIQIILTVMEIVSGDIVWVQEW